MKKSMQTMRFLGHGFTERDFSCCTVLSFMFSSDVIGSRNSSEMSCAYEERRPLVSLSTGAALTKLLLSFMLALCFICTNESENSFKPHSQC